jgi:hypothetical protein
MPAAHTDAQTVLTAALPILEEQQPMTLRALFYQLVSRQVITNNVSAYARLGKRLVRWRQEGRHRAVGDDRGPHPLAADSADVA